MKIIATENASLSIKINGGKITKDGKEENIGPKTIYLCRCGGSKNKPFCDGTHRSISFHAESAEIEIE